MSRLNQRFQEDKMPCANPCKKCQSNKLTGHINFDYVEIDPSPMASQAQKWLNSPSTFLDRLCSLEPSAPECKTYD